MNKLQLKERIAGIVFAETLGKAFTNPNGAFGIDVTGIADKIMNLIKEYEQVDPINQGCNKL